MSIWIVWKNVIQVCQKKKNQSSTGKINHNKN